MGDVTAIAWTDFTYNHWEGCTKVGPGCDACYAEARNQRFAAGANWGPGAPRRLTSAHNRNNPYRWNRKVAQTGKRWVFCSSLADVADNEVDPAWRQDLKQIISACTSLQWQLVTKRIGNILPMFGGDWLRANPHVGIVATMVNQEEIDRDMAKLLAVAEFSAWVGLSIEPQIGPIVLWTDYLALGPRAWTIVGGESKQRGHDCRPFDVDWARSIIRQCRQAGSPVFVKQIGSNPTMHGFVGMPIQHHAGAEPDEWPEEIRVREMPALEKVSAK